MKKSKILEEIEKFLEQTNSDDFDEMIDNLELTPYEMASVLLEEIEECRTKKEKREKINEALELCPDCFLAYVELSFLDNNKFSRIELLRKAASMGAELAKQEDQISSASDALVLSDYLQTLKFLADAYWTMERFEEAIDCLYKIYSLQSFDYFSIRYSLISLLCLNNRDEEALEIVEEFEGDPSAHMDFFKALVYYRLQNYDDALKYLEVGNKKNKHIINFMLNNHKIKPQYVQPSFRHGSREEACDFVLMSRRAFYNTKGLIDTLIKIHNSENTDCKVVS